LAILSETFGRKYPNVEELQDIVEEVMIRSGFAAAAKAYILYRQRRTEVREVKKFLGVRDELKVSVNAAKVLRERYLRKDEYGNVIETPGELFHRVAETIANVDLLYGAKKKESEKTEERFFQMMADAEFLPNSPTLMNAGLKLSQLAACFVLPIEDSVEDIFDAVKWMAQIHKSGGGTGFSFSKIRAANDIISSTMGKASGPVSFMRVFDVTTEVIKQGGRRRGANMGILHVEHPDIEEFVTAKQKPDFLTNFNISVAATDKFIRAVLKNKRTELISPRSGRVIGDLPARDLFEKIVQAAWQTGDPGMIFIDEINRKNPTKFLGPIEATNPCGEQPLHPFEACNLGSISLYKVVNNKKIDWQKLRGLVEDGVHFLDNVIDASKFPLRQTAAIVKANRRIGLGVMGWAEMLLALGIPYDSRHAISVASDVMQFIQKTAHKKSIELGKQRGNFPNFRKSVWHEKGYPAMRNATVTTVAPTGTISIIGDTSSGIEPIFAVAFVRHVMEGVQLFETNKVFEQVAREQGFYSRELMLNIARTGSVQNIIEVPKAVQRVFKNALEIEPIWHIKMQAAFQKYVDNSVSKTINLPTDASPQDVSDAYIAAFEMKCKGITIFRYGSKPSQVLFAGLGEADDLEKHVSAGPEFSGFSGSCAGGECSF